MSVINIVLLLLGIVIALYAIYVTKKAKADEDFHSVCDLSDKVSCKKFLVSQYARPFGIPVSPTATLVYIFLIIAEWMGYTTFVMWSTGVMLVVVAILALLAEVKLKTSCLTCYGTMLVAAVLFFGNYFHWW